MIRNLVLCACAVFAMTAGGATVAQAFPDKPIRMIVPYPPGGGADAIARTISQRLSETLGQAVVIENKPGANGNIGSAFVAKAAPDGYTLLMNTIGLVFSQSIYKSLPFNVLNDFVPVALVAGVPHILIVGPSLPVNSVAELLAAAKAKPGKINYASVGVGSPFQMAGALFQSVGQVELAEIPYQGGGPAVQSVVAGQTDMTFANLLAAQPLIKAGRVKALAVTSSKRSAIAPDVPTLAESGLAGYDLSGWFGIWAPAGTPKPIVETLNAAIVKVLNEPEIRARLERDGAEVVASSPAEFDRYVRSEYAKWDKVIKAARIHAD
jgi:tripartite-type tricarboxylate transporter receptor subunit TctC